MAQEDLFPHITRLAAASQSRRAVLGRLGLGSIAAGVLTTSGAGAMYAQGWDDAPASADEAPTPPAPFPGITGGMPPFAYGLEASQPQEFAAGSIRWATGQQVSTLEGVSAASLRLAPGGLREVHWNLNAHELSYCLAGAGKIGIFAPDGSSETLDIRPGSITFVPNGYTHYVQNTGPDELHLLVTYTHRQPESTGLSQALPGIPTPLLAQTFGLPASEFPFLATRGNRVIVPLSAADAGEPASTPLAALPSSYGINVDQLAVRTFAGGTVQPLTDEQIPLLQGITVFPLEAVPHGLREPHWHPNAGELNYCVSGRAQVGLVAPDGDVQTFTVEAGDIAFIPLNWIHYVANSSDEPLRFLIFFITADARVQTINLSQTFGVVPPDVLAASFDADPALFAVLPKVGNVGIAPPVAQE